MSVLIVSEFEATAQGHGGNHRSLQVMQDFSSLGPTVRLVHLRRSPPRHNTWHRIRRTAIRLRSFGEQPASLLYGMGISNRHGVDSEFGRRFDRELTRIRPDIVVFEHPVFASLMDCAAAAGAVTVACFHSLESVNVNLDAHAWLWHSVNTARRRTLQSLLRAQALGAHLGAELYALAVSANRLTISRYEVSLLGAMGIPSRHYAYVPRGGVATQLTEIRVARTPATISPGHFVLLGSNPTGPNYHAWISLLTWLRERGGLPGNLSLTVVGARSGELEEVCDQRGVTLVGRLSADELAKTLSRCEGVLVPQSYGAGVLTRLAEMSAAGVPTLASEFATGAAGVIPGVQAVDGGWRSWLGAMKEARGRRLVVPREDFQHWSEIQATPRDLLARPQIWPPGPRDANALRARARWFDGE